MRRPTAAERARTLAYGVAGGALRWAGTSGWEENGPYEPVPAHATDAAGRPLLLMSAASPVAAALLHHPDVPATLRIADVAPVALPDRVRGQAWLHGWLTEIPSEERRAAAVTLSRLHPRPELLDLDGGRERGQGWTVLDLEIAEVEISDGWGHTVLGPEEYAAATPDPFVAIEPGMLTHLDIGHRAELVGLFRERFGHLRPEPVVRPLALDRHGLWLRCAARDSGGPEPFDLRVEFPCPVSDLHGLRCAYRELFAARTT